MSGKELFKKIVSMGVEYDYHGTDLYFPLTADTSLLVDEYEFKNNVKTFEYQGEFWFDVPFAYPVKES